MSWTYNAESDVGICGRVPTLENAFEDPGDPFRSQFGDPVALYGSDDLFTHTLRSPPFSDIASVQSIINTEIIQPVIPGNATTKEACSVANKSVREAIDGELA